MEHIVQFGISIDDDAIKKTVENNVINQVACAIKNDTIKAIVGKKEFNNFEYTSKLQTIVNDTANQFCDKYKDEIIEVVSDKLVEKLTKTKAVKDMLSKTLDSILN